MRFQVAQYRNSSAHRHRIAGESSSLIDRSQGSNLAHDIGAPTVGRQRKTSANDFAERREIGLDSIKLLRAAQGQAESSHHFIEDQQRAVPVGENAQSFERALA